MNLTFRLQIVPILPDTLSKRAGVPADQSTYLPKLFRIDSPLLIYKYTCSTRLDFGSPSSLWRRTSNNIS